MVCLALVAAAPCLSAAAEPDPPNVVLILVDDLGWADVRCYGNTFNETPNIDRLASQGMRFSDAYAACCVCSPTRASIVTGRYPARLHLTDFIAGHPRPWARLIAPDFEKQLSLEEVTIAEALKPAGYVPASFGKWHLGGPTHYPGQQGFDRWIVTGGPHFGTRYDAEPPITVPKDAYEADVLTEHAERFIEQNRDRPFFLLLSHFAVHIPLEAKKELITKYQGKKRPRDGVNHPVYAAMLESVDESVGRIAAKLDALELAERTLLIFTSDNGGLIRMFRGTGPVVTSNAPLRSEKGTLYEGGIRIPLIVRWPGVVRPGTVSDTPACTVDFLPTILDAVGARREPARELDGVSLMPLLKQTGGLDRDALYWHYPHYHHDTPTGAIREGHYKLIERYEDGSLELYNLAADIGERMNLADRMPEKAASLRDKLARWRESVHAQMPVPNPAFDPTRQDEWGYPRRAVRVPEPTVFAPGSPGDVKAPDGSPTTDAPFTVNVPASLLGERGTFALWFRPAKLLRGEKVKYELISGDGPHVFVDSRDSEVWLLFHSGPAITGTRENARSRFYWTGAPLTHLKEGRWYHLGWAWDTQDASRNGLFLDGIRQSDGQSYDYDGLLKAADGEIPVTVGAEGLTVSAMQVFGDALEETQLASLRETTDYPRYTDEGVRFTAARFHAADVDADHPVYVTDFDDASALADWRLEGRRRMSVADGNLVLESDPDDAGNHLVCWLTREVPADFLLEFTVRPEDRLRGLNIVFFNARGRGGESIFDASLEPRTGIFKQYTQGDLDNYHASYWAGGRGTANLRKNHGFHLAAIGPDLVYTVHDTAFQTVRLYKRGGMIRLTVDDVVSVAYDDDGASLGPVHAHSGWIGLRQMGHTGRCEYGYVRVLPLMPE